MLVIQALVWAIAVPAVRAGPAVGDAPDPTAEFTRLLNSTGREYVDVRGHLLTMEVAPLAARLRGAGRSDDWQTRCLARALLYRAEAGEPAEAVLGNLPPPWRGAIPRGPLPPTWKDVLPAFEHRQELAPLLVEALLKDAPEGPSVFVRELDGTAVSGYWVRQCAASALGDAGGPEAARPLLWAVSHDESKPGWLRTAACFGLLKLGDHQMPGRLRAEAEQVTDGTVKGDLTATAGAIELRCRAESLWDTAMRATGERYLDASRALAAATADSREVLLLTAIRRRPEAVLLAHAALGRAFWRRQGPTPTRVAAILSTSPVESGTPDVARWREDFGEPLLQIVGCELAELLLKDRGRRESQLVHSQTGAPLPSAWVRACAAVGLGLTRDTDGPAGVSTALERHAWTLFEDGAIEAFVEALALDDEAYVHELAQFGLRHFIEMRAWGGSAKHPLPLPRGDQLLAKATDTLQSALAGATNRQQRRRLQSAIDALRNIRAPASGTQGHPGAP